MKKTIHAFLLRLASASVLAALLFAVNPSALADYTWNVGSGTTPAQDSAKGNWDTASENWTTDGGGTTTWTDGNNAIFVSNGFFQNITITGNRQVGKLSFTGTGGTYALKGNYSLDVTEIYAQTQWANHADIFTKLTGNHDLTLSGDGRVTFKVASDYTGATIVKDKFMIYSDAVDNALSTTTTLNLTTKDATYLLAGKNQQIALLTGNGKFQGRNLVNNTLTIHTATGTSGIFSGTLNGYNGSTDGTHVLNLVISGAGTQELTGVNSYVGTTTLSGGTLKLGSSLTHTSSVIINGGTLETSVANVTLGTGAVSMSSGAIMPGGIGTAATLTLAADQDFIVTGGILNFDLGAASDQIIGSGSGLFSLAGATLALSLADGFDYSLTYGILQGFAGGDVSGLAITGYDTANWTASLDASGLLSFTASNIPEPATWAFLLSVTTLAIAAVMRRRK